MVEPPVGAGGSGGDKGDGKKEAVLGDQVDGEEKMADGGGREGGEGIGSGSGNREGDDGESHAWGPVPSLEDRFEGLHLCGEEEIDLDFSDELEDLVKEIRWLAIFKVHTTRQFSHSALFNAMRTAWTSAQQVFFKPKGANIFIAQFSCLGDWRRVMDGGPWLFRNAAVIIQEYDGFSNVNDYKLDKIPVWARIEGVPDGLMRKKELAEKVARKVGEPPITVMVNEGFINTSKYLRARVFLDVHVPLVRFVPITLKERKKYPVYYEKLPDFCFLCGLMGHLVEECGDGVHDPSVCEWGDWIMWNFDNSATRQNLGRGGGRGASERGGRELGGRGGWGRGGTGRGNVDREVNEHTEMEYSSQDVRSNGEVAQRGARKRLVSQDGTVNAQGQQGVLIQSGTVAGKVLQIEAAPSKQETTSGTPGKIPIVKRRRQGEGDEGEEDEPMTLAASQVDVRRVQ